ncbi:MAG: purine-nucleoside phosphorylase [Gemmatimonadota bacterium]|nr:purine-nucleoside phosphorylase [Gemmatimonadota bacterium]
MRGAPAPRGIDVETLVARARRALDRAGAGAAEAGLILGSGLSFLADELEGPVRAAYDEIPGFPRTTVEGHAGNFVVGTLEGRTVAMAQGRFHLYEGYDPAAVALTVRVLHVLGARWMLVTNAAGSVDFRMEPGTLMAIRDQLNLQFANPLRGRPPGKVENPFPDMSNPYDRELRRRLHAVALEEGIELREGVYAGVPGPSYETPAEVTFLRRAGADAVGMSTVGEVVAAAELELPVVGISLLTNFAAGLAAGPLRHEEVTETAARSRDRFARLVRAFLRATR